MLSLPGGVRLRSPVLMPSLSTRNVGFLEISDDGSARSLASLAFEWLPGQVTESLLVSAYDLHHGALGDAGELLRDGAPSALREPELLMIDSGQYEARQRPPVGPDQADGTGWRLELMIDVYNSLPADMPAALVSWDEQDLPYREQVARAQSLFVELPGRATVMLLKPEDRRNSIEPAKVGAVAAELQQFSIVGVTEKELGSRLGERLSTLAELRRTLDAAGVEAPIHVFGGLDPLMTPLYIMCGAEIVDGVGWLRYAYLEDAAQYLENRALRDLDLDAKVPQRTFHTINDNLLYLADLKRRLQALVADGDLASFSEARGKMLNEIWRRVAISAGEA